MKQATTDGRALTLFSRDDWTKLLSTSNQTGLVSQGMQAWQQSPKAWWHVATVAYFDARELKYVAHNVYISY